MGDRVAVGRAMRPSEAVGRRAGTTGEKQGPRPDPPAAGVPFGASGLTLSPADLEWLAKANGRTGRAAGPTTTAGGE